MSLHEKKLCARCGGRFVCKPGNITECHCFLAPLSPHQQDFLERQYADCLCSTCLAWVRDHIRREPDSSKGTGNGGWLE